MQAVPATRESILHFRNLGIFPAQISCYANREDNFNQQQGKADPPIDGPVPKYWGNVQAARAPYILRVARDPNTGDYLTRAAGSWRRSNYRATDPEYVWLNYYNNYQLGVFDILKTTYPDAQIPLLEVVPIDYAEFGRMSFPFDEFADPMDYPVGEVWEGGRHSFPGSYVLIMGYVDADGKTSITNPDDGKQRKFVPIVYHVEEALKAYPVTWGPQKPTDGGSGAGTGSGLDAAKVYAAMEKLAKSQATRVQAATVFSSGASVQDKLAALLRL